MTPFVLDWEREERTGIPEAVLAEGKSDAHLHAIVTAAHEASQPILITRLEPARKQVLPARFEIDYDALSRTAICGIQASETRPGIAVVAAGTSDLAVAGEAARTLQFLGFAPESFVDVGVAGLWRLTARIEEIRTARVVIAVAGMEGALFSVLTGLVRAPVIAVPTSVGYGVGADGRAALSSALASCAPGLVTVNVDNGFGAAAAAAKMLALVDGS